MVSRDELLAGEHDGAKSGVVRILSMALAVRAARSTEVDRKYVVGSIQTFYVLESHGSCPYSYRDGPIADFCCVLIAQGCGSIILIFEIRGHPYQLIF